MKFRNLLMKDLRTVAWEASILILLYAALLWMDLQLPGDDILPVILRSSAPSWCVFLVFLGWFAITARIVHAEPVFDVRSYWRSRPISPARLLASKACALLLLLTVPLIASQAILLLANSFSPIALWPDLVKQQASYWAFAIIPMLAIASLTSSMATMVFTTACILLASLFLPLVAVSSSDLAGGVGFELHPWPLVPGLNVAASLLVLFLGYGFRRSRMAWAVVVLVVLFPIITIFVNRLWPGVFSQRQPLSQGSPSVVLDETVRSTMPVAVEGGNPYYVLPLRLTGAPDGAILSASYPTIQLPRPDNGELAELATGPEASSSMIGATYFMRNEQPHIAFILPETYIQEGQSRRLSLKLRLQGWLHTGTRTEQHPALGDHLTLSDRLHCSSSTTAALRIEYRCATAYSQMTSLLFRLPQEDGEIEIPWLVARYGMVAGPVGQQPTMLSPVDHVVEYDIVSKLRGMALPTRLHFALESGATVEALESGEWVSMEIVLADLEFEFPRKRRNE